ncbi:MAG: hypothetical protein H0W06_08805 [Chloroflexia bacterium]|nr:hypothetical protein [Chloroflexia bacterium]
MALREKQQLSPAVEELLRRNREEAARFREQHGDPREALDRFVRETYDYDTLLHVYIDMFERGNVWDDADLIDEPQDH